MFTHFYHQTLEKAVAAFGTLFNKIYVAQYDADNNEVKRTLVPINYANRQAYIARQEAQPDLEDEVYVEAIFPRMSFEISSLTYDPNRKLNTIHRNYTDAATNGEKEATYNAVPYNIEFTLSIVAKYMRDANQILEQILPYFSPSYTIQMLTIPEMGYVEDVVLEFSGSPLFSDNYQDELNGAQRQIRYDLNFKMMVNFYGPVEAAKVIKRVQVDISTPKDFSDATLSATPRIARDTITTNPPNVDPPQTFGYVETYEEFNDGKKYNPVTDADDEIS